MKKELEPQYDPKKVEDKIYKLWEESGFFAPEAREPRADNPNSKKTFSIVVPPPNITGSLHMGHALNATIQDILIRKKRMQGFKTLWLPGTDHASIATQYVIEKELKKEGLTRHDLGREKFLERAWAWKEKYGHIILDQFKKLGSSMDWSRTRFTMDPEYTKSVETAFLSYYKKGLIYKAEKVVNWCYRCSTTLSDLELEYKEADSNLYFINYPFADGGGSIMVATTRPETMLGDTAVAVNPSDERYKKIIGKEVLLPIQKRKIPIIADSKIDKEFGTGAVKVTPAHDILDAEIGARHNLPFIKIIGPNGRMTEAAGLICAGLKVEECRIKVVEELKRENALEREESYKHNVAVCYRCGTVVEPMPSEQWFLKMGDLAKKAILGVKSGKVKFHPKRWEKVYFDWLKNIRDWPISRQLWWGQKIPLEGENDVLDTWFSSALWPFATFGWPEKTKDLKEFYPTSVLSTARDIINLWVSRMIFSGLEFTGQVPFKDVIVHATILTKDGKRMSKSLGTGVDPLMLIEKFGSDALRFGLIWQAMGNQDIHWSEEHVIAGKKFCNKMWNASRFVLLQIFNFQFPISKQIPNHKFQIPNKIKPKTSEDKKILAEFEKVKKTIDKQIEKYEFGQALHELYDFFWHKFCDIYLEASKTQIADEKLNKSTRDILIYVLSGSIKLLHPFMPFITEEIWSHLPIKDKKLLLVENWPD